MTRHLRLALCLLAASTVAAAQTPNPPRPASEPIVAPQIDRRDIRKPRYPSNDLELGLFTGAYATESFGTSLVYGVRAGYHITEDFFAEAVFAQSNVTDELFRQILPGGVFAGDDKQKLTYYNLSVGYNVLPGEVFIWRARAMPSQLYLIAGIGSTKFVDQRKATYNAGFGFRVFPHDRFSIRLDVRDHVFALDLLGRRSTTHNIEFTGGLSVLF